MMIVFNFKFSPKLVKSGGPTNSLFFSKNGSVFVCYTCNKKLKSVIPGGQLHRLR